MFVVTVKGNNDLFITTSVHTIIDEFIWAIKGEKNRLIANLKTLANVTNGSMQMIQQTRMKKWKQLEPNVQFDHKNLPCPYGKNNIIAVSET
jgi:hypothetical protein